MSSIKKIKSSLTSSYIVKNILTVLSYDIISKVFSILITVLIIRSLSKTDYAYFTFYQAIASLFVSIIGSGLVASYIRYDTEKISRLKIDTKSLYLLNFKLITGIFFAIYVLMTLFGEVLLNYLFKDGDYSFYFMWGLVLAYSMSLFRLNIGYYQSRDKFKMSGKILNANNMILMILILVALALKSLDVLTILYIYIFSFIIIAGIGFLKINKEKSLYKKEAINLKEYFESSSWLVFYYILIGIFSKIDILMITSFLDEESLANYGVANKYFLLLLTLLPSIKAVLMVRTSKVDMVDNLQSQKNFTLQWILKSTPYILVISAMIFLSTDFIFPILNGDIYEDAVGPFKIFVIGTAFSYIFAPNVDILRSMKKFKTLTMLGFIACISNICLNLYLIPLYGINGAAATTVISQLFINISSTIIVIKSSKSI